MLAEKVTFDLHLSQKSRAFIEQLSDSEYRQITRLLGILCLDPSIDGRTKFSLPYPPIILCLYQAEAFNIVYHLVDNHVVHLLAIGYAPGIPPLFSGRKRKS